MESGGLHDQPPLVLKAAAALTAVEGVVAEAVRWGKRQSCTGEHVVARHTLLKAPALVLWATSVTRAGLVHLLLNTSKCSMFR
jgi:hypothetical protein